MFERIQNTFYTEISYHFQNPLEILHVLFDGVSKNYYNHVPNRTLGICTWFHSSLIQVLFYPLEIQLHIDCCPKFATGLKCLNRSKNIWVTRLFFCQYDSLMGESFWQQDSLVTLILFELSLFWYLAQSQILRNRLYVQPFNDPTSFFSFSVRRSPNTVDTD